MLICHRFYIKISIFVYDIFSRDILKLRSMLQGQIQWSFNRAKLPIASNIHGESVTLTVFFSSLGKLSSAKNYLDGPAQNQSTTHAEKVSSVLSYLTCNFVVSVPYNKNHTFTLLPLNHKGS